MCMGGDMSRETTDKLYPLVAAGDQQAREQMILANMDLVATKVDFFLREFPRFRYLEDDLISAGYLGLVEAVDRFSSGEAHDKNPTGYIGMRVLAHLGLCIEDEQPIKIPSTTRRRGIHAAPTVISMSDITIDKEADDPYAHFEVLDEILSCCWTDTEEQIVMYREKGYKDTAIAELTGLSTYTVHALRKEICERFQSRRSRQDEETI